MKKLFAIVISMAMIVAMMPSMAFATGVTPEVTPDYGWYGDGTATEYTISTEKELLGFANIVNGSAGDGNPQKNNFSGKTVTLKNDITLTSANWTPIGAGVRADKTYQEGSSPFEGTFDGNNKEISGLKITSESGDRAVGLFGIVKGGTIKNLKLTDVEISVPEDELAGGAVGFLVNNGTVRDVEVGGSISAKAGVGGVVGRMTLSGTITGCKNRAEVSAVNSNAGGIVGAAYYTAEDKEIKISNCVNKGKITGGNVCIGGIAGLSAANISDCKNEGEIKGTNSTDVAVNSVGGIVGGYQSYGSVTGCTNVADVSINGQSATNGAGGIVGWIRYSDSSSKYERCAAVEVKDNINKGSVRSNGISAGGIVGHVQYMAVVTGNKNYAGTISSNNFAAGIVGSVQEYADGEVKENNNAKKGLNVNISNNLTTTRIETQEGKCFTDVVWNNVSGEGRTNVTYTAERNIAGKVKVGDKGYWTLAEAVTGVDENGTITLLDNVTLTKTVEIAKNVTISLDGKTITGDKCRVFWVKSGGDLNVTGEGKITSVNVEDHTKSVVRVGDSGTAGFKMGEGVTIEAPSTYGVTIFGTGTQSITINGTINCTYGSEDACAVAGQGSSQYNANEVKTTITIGGRAKLTTRNDVAIYKPNTGKLTIEDDAYIEGLGGIEVKAGEVVISGNPTIKATAETPSNEYNSDGSSTKGYAVSVMNIATGDGYKGKADVEIDGGTFTGGVEILDNVTTGKTVDEEKKGKISITGGTFSTNPSEYLADHYEATEASDKDEWTVGLEKHDVTFNANGGSGEMNNQSMEYNVATKLNKNKFARKGYTFSGWSVSESGGEKSYQDEASIAITKATTLYAQWTPAEYSITYELNGGENGEAAPTEHTYGVETTLVSPTKPGYTFAGWYTDAGFTGSAITTLGAEEYTANITLYAKWTINKYTVTFESNGGSEVSPEQADYGTAVGEPNAPTKTGYTFAGWYKDAACTEGNEYSFGTAVTENITLYAKWTANKYTISFDANSGEGEMAGQSMTYDTTQALAQNAFTKTGYTFAGWAETKDGAVVYQDRVNVNNLTDEDRGVVTLYAVWTQNSYTVAFNPNEGAGSMVSQTMTYDEETSLSKNLFTRIGYTFKEWNTNADGSGTAYKDCAEVENLTDAADGTVTLYAQWTIDKYVVTFNNTGSSVIPPQTVEYNKPISWPADPAREGYKFLGWFEDDGAWTKEETVTNDLTLTAHWEKEKTGNVDGVTTSTETIKETDGETEAETTGTKETVTEKKTDGTETKTVTENTTTTNKNGSTEKTTATTVTETNGSGDTVEVKNETVETKAKDGSVTKIVTTDTETTVNAENGQTEIKQTEVVKDKKANTTTTTKSESVEKDEVTTTETTKTTIDASGKTIEEKEKTVTDQKSNVSTSTTVAETTATTEAEVGKQMQGSAKTIKVDATAMASEADKVKAAEVKLNASTVTNLNEAASAEGAESAKVKAVEVKTNVATLTIDNEAIKTLTEQGKDSDDTRHLLLKVEKKESTDGAEDTKENTKFSLTAVLTDGETETPVFEETNKDTNGTIKVSVSYEKKSSRSNLTVYYVDENGNRTEMPTSYSGSILSWTTNHFSEFEVVETVKSSSGGGGSYTPVTPGAGGETKDEETKDETTKTDEKIAAENAAKAVELTSALTLKARSAKTAKGNIKVTLTVNENAIQQIEGLGYTVKYKFYRSTKKALGYAAKYEKANKTYTNTAGTKGTRYYYKARVMVYDAEGTLIAKTALTQCKYACRIR